MPPLDPYVLSGPQGPRVVLDGTPVLLLCSDNALGFADHPRVREAAADAALRWGAGAGGAFAMTVHRRLEAALAAFLDADGAALFGTVRDAVAAVLPSGASVWREEAARVDVPGATTFRRGDVEHLAWLLARARAGESAPSAGPFAASAAVLVEGVAARDGVVAPVAELAALAREHGLRLVVDESHALGCAGPGGRGTIAEAGAGDIAVAVGSLGTALGSFGAFAAGGAPGRATTRLDAEPSLPPPVAAAALAALELLAEQPRRVAKLHANAAALRDELASECFDVTGSETHIVPLAFRDAAVTERVCALALEDGVLVRTDGAAAVRLAVTAAHSKSELRSAARTLARAALRAGDRAILRAA